MNHRATVLVVDDDPDTVETMRDILEEEGHTVLSARNGLEGLEVALRCVPDLVLLDLEMPIMDGRAFLEALRKAPTLADVTVVVLSATADTGVGCESVQKPLRLDTLLGLIDRVAGAAPCAVSAPRVGGERRGEADEARRDDGSAPLARDRGGRELDVLHEPAAVALVETVIGRLRLVALFEERRELDGHNDGRALASEVGGRIRIVGVGNGSTHGRRVEHDSGRRRRRGRSRQNLAKTRLFPVELAASQGS
jgi:CheY-like chemotaxis protein